LLEGRTKVLRQFISDKKILKESYKRLGGSHYRNCVLCRVSKTLGKGYFTLGKGFAECNARQRTLGKDFIGKGFFAECFLTLGKVFAECQKALGKEKHSAN
jgi:hypothetical protein